ncbi:serine protease persephone isoform X3 [Scaptodrosophila lebanonensis]|uniref:Serine protease persephone isoform X3 n=1 Tax=Drosophila lebanonensis TaxID=7225 RepID=A0A6J2TV31_DROLE|nr:serine protease persephone isoform X3 [Scaptodrosophila lebanonensis]
MQLHCRPHSWRRKNSTTITTTRSWSFALLSCGLIFVALPKPSASTEGDTCRIDKLNMNGRCTASNMCESIIDDYFRAGKLTSRDVPSCGFSAREEIVCCPTVKCCPDDRSGDSIVSTTTPKSESRNPERPAVTACQRIEAREEIGRQISMHILDGIPVEEGIYPHMAAIGFRSFGTEQFRCGGSLVDKRFVLTAAHCVNDGSPEFVRLGTVDIEKKAPGYQDIAVNASKIVIHPDYVSTSKYHDIAILELESDAIYTPNVYPACLETTLQDPPPTANVFVAGWGVMNTTTKLPSKLLLRAPLDIVPIKSCNESYAAQPPSRRHLADGVQYTQLCAADLTKQKADACQGDSGGPLIWERNVLDGLYSIVGIISAGFGCNSNTPGLYTRVAAYLDFIESVVWPDARRL